MNVNNPNPQSQTSQEHLEESKTPMPTTRAEIVECLVKELTTQFSRDQLPLNHYYFDRVTQDLQIPLHFVSRENKIKAYTSGDQEVLKEAISKCSNIKLISDPNQGEMIKINIPCQYFFIFRDIPIANKVHFDTWLKDCPVEPKITSRDLEEKYSIYKLTVPNREVSDELFKWLDAKKTFKGEKLSFRREGENIYDQLYQVYAVNRQ